MHNHHQEPWVESAIFWIEGIATPGISLGGLLGKADNYDHDYGNDNDDNDNDNENDDDNNGDDEDGEDENLDDEDGDDGLFQGNFICILVLSKNKNSLDLKPSFTNLLIGLVRYITTIFQSVLTKYFWDLF